MIQIRHAAALAAAAVALASCRSDDRAPEIASTRPFAEAFERVSSVTLEQSDSLPIVAPMKPAVSPRDGTFALPDFSEGHVRLFDTAGKHVRTLGRKGHGPGEFIAPVSTGWDSSGRLHVLDIQRAIISVFDPGGKHVREVSLAKVGTVTDFAALADGGYLLLGSASPEALLTRTDSAGQPVRTYLPIARFMPPGASNASAWDATLMPQMRVDGTTAYVILSPADSLWTVDLATGATASSPIRPEGYLVPRDPDGPIDGEALNAWIRSADRVRGLGAEGSRAYLTFARGPFEDPEATLLVRDAQGRVDAFTGADVVQEVVGGRLLTIQVGDTAVTLGWWRPRP